MKTAEEAEQKTIQSGKPIGLIGYQQQAVVSREIIAQEARTVSLFAFDEGQRLSEHTAPFDAFVFVPEGSVEIRIGGTPPHLGAR